ncbi:cofilin [Naegleria gruberi]|uniref:Cofilin n=1 Tax=Naegleria gruberi TaxID=5762 RepID=D2VZT4_NAEGR|nr:cofilin [Naegleria gruberi]EFC37627.1 cofilin [Naegleria gruberi]|eukprot:XP_002670371.1 cofilin [Naegleria gruberi]
MMLNCQFSDEILKTYEEMRMGKGSNKDKKFLVLKMQESSIQIDQELSQLSSLDELTANLPPKNSRFICYHLSFEMPSQNETCQIREGTRTKMMFLTWCPNETNVKEKFQVAATVKTVKQKLNGLSATIHCSTKSEIDERSMIEKCLTFMK